MKPKTPRETDVRIGQNIRNARLAARLSQGKLADAVGVTFQQIQKYEKGSNRVGGSRMEEISQVLGVSISTLFGDDKSTCLPLMSSESVKLARDFEKITSPAIRSAVMVFVRSVAKCQDDEATASGKVDHISDDTVTDLKMSAAH